MLKRVRYFLTASCLIWLAGCAAANRWQSAASNEHMRRVGWSEEYQKQIEGRLIFLDLTSDARALRLECRENIFTNEADFLYANFSNPRAIDVKFYFCRGNEFIYPQGQEIQAKWRQSFLSRLGNEELEGLPEPAKEKAKAVLRFATVHFASYP